MQSNNENLCRLCLELVHATNAVVINEVATKMLGVLLIKLDLDVSEDPLLCCMCSNVLDEIYLFKSKCLYSEDIISDHFDSNLKVSLRDILIEIQNNPDVKVAEDEVICRLCIKIPANDNYVFLNKTDLELGFSRGMMQIHLLPEINLCITEDPIVCEECYILLKSYTAFVNNCVDVERKIKLYNNHREANDKGPVNLHCVRFFTENKAIDSGSNLNEDLMIKQEEGFVSSKAEQFENEEDDLWKDQRICAPNDKSNAQLNIKTEEVDIKDEDNAMRVVPSGSSGSGNNGSSTKKGRIRKEYSCFLCTFIADKKCLLEAHMKSHRGPTKVYGCPECHHYETDLKHNMIQHLLKHKDMSDTDMHKCPLCPLKSKYKATLRNHLKHQHSTNVKMYNCMECSYSTKYSSAFMNHQVKHRQGKEFCCEMCNFKTIYKRSLERHIKLVCLKSISGESNTPRKKSSSMWIGKYAPKEHSCFLCSFIADKKYMLKDHMKSHRGASKEFGCPECHYETDVKCRMVQHILKHEDESDTNMHKCPLCPLKSKYETTLLNHLKLQHSTNIKIHKCKECSFSTKYRGAFVSHQLIHEKSKLFCCEMCNFKTKYKRSLRRHMKVTCLKSISSESNQSGDCSSSGNNGSSMRIGKCAPKEYSCFLCTFIADKRYMLKDHMKCHRGPTKALGCPECQYETDFKCRMVQHIPKHKDVSDMDIHKCPLCPLKTKYRTTLWNHMKLQHKPNMKLYRCKECSLSSKYKRTIVRHQCPSRLIESKPLVREEATLNCGKCEFQTNDTSSLQDHMDQQCRSNQPIFKCHQCGYSTWDKGNLDQHQVTMHLLQDVMFCAMCNFKTKYKGNLRRHIELCSKRKA